MEQIRRLALTICLSEIPDDPVHVLFLILRKAVSRDAKLVEAMITHDRTVMVARIITSALTTSLRPSLRKTAQVSGVKKWLMFVCFS
jgi:hypothetical protein